MHKLKVFILQKIFFYKELQKIKGSFLPAAKTLLKNLNRKVIKKPRENILVQAKPLPLVQIKLIVQIILQEEIL